MTPLTIWKPWNPERNIVLKREINLHFFKGENINICWSPDGQTIAVGNKDDVVTFIDAKTHRSKAEEQFKFEVNEISWNNDNDMFFLTNGNGCINILR